MKRALSVALNLTVLLSITALAGFYVSGYPVVHRPLAPDFDLSMDPDSIVIALGATSAPVSITVRGRNNFKGLVSASIEGLPLGVRSSPSSPFLLAPGVGVQITLSVGDAVPLGLSRFTIRCVRGAIAHNVQAHLLVKSVDTSYQAGSMLYLESRAHGEIVRVGLESRWGGSIVELSWNGVNPVNRHDAGREVQVALYDGSAKYDGCAGCKGVFGWNPVQAGDRYSHGSPVLQRAMDGHSIYIKTQPYEWYPDDKGGGPNQPVPTDTYVEQWISTVPEHFGAFRVHYRVTHFGNDEHDNAIQEFPAVYVDLRFRRFAYYAGPAPWTDAPVTVIALPETSSAPRVHIPELWSAFVNQDDIGLTVYVPGQCPYGVVRSFAGTTGRMGSGTHYYHPLAFFSLTPNLVIEGDIYLIPGDYRSARNVIYGLRSASSARDSFAPFGFTDMPTTGSEISGVAEITGWALDNVAVSKVEVFVDGRLAGTAEYGLRRADVATEYPNAPENIGFRYGLNTTQYGNGLHMVQVRVSDSSGNVAFFPRVGVRITN